MPERFSRTYNLEDGERLSDAVMRGLQARSEYYGGGPVEVSIGRPKATPKQFRYLFGFIYPTIQRYILEEGRTPPTKGRLHGYLCTVVLGEEAYEVAGRVIVERKSSTKLDMTEMHYLIEGIKLEENLVLPLCIDWEAEERNSEVEPPPKPEPESELPPLEEFAAAKAESNPTDGRCSACLLYAEGYDCGADDCPGQPPLSQADEVARMTPEQIAEHFG